MTITNYTNAKLTFDLCFSFQFFWANTGRTSTRCNRPVKRSNRPTVGSERRRLQCRSVVSSSSWSSPVLQFDSFSRCHLRVTSSTVFGCRRQRHRFLDPPTRCPSSELRGLSYPKKGPKTFPATLALLSLYIYLFLVARREVFEIRRSIDGVFDMWFCFLSSCGRCESRLFFYALRFFFMDLACLSETRFCF